MTEDDILMELLSAAYVRGVEWARENPPPDDLKYKAANDYADKMIGAARTLAEVYKARYGSEKNK